MKNIVIAIFIAAVFYTFWFVGNYPKAFYYIDLAYGYVHVGFSDIAEKIKQSVVENLAAVLVHKPVTAIELKDKYNANQNINNSTSKKVRVLIVPGHEPNYGGTEYGGLKEREINVQLARNLAEFLKNNGRYDVMMSRDEKSWNPVFESYFRDNWDEIVTFFKDNKGETLRLVNTGAVTKPIATITHNKARPDVAMRLYGINKWENENAIDIAIHVHFNDYPRRDTSKAGKYSGFAIYVPEKLYANSSITQVLASTVFKRLSKYNAVSNLPAEDAGVIEAPDLIAIGAYNTTNSASMLIEYGYIYEPQFATPVVRASTLKDLAFQTYLGLQDFFGSGNDVSFAYDTLMLPHSWNNNLTASTAGTDDVLALQSALLLDGLYPGQGKSKNDCPRSGKIGPCTLGAIEAFQKKYGITGERGMVGEQTKKVLNDKYSVKRL